MALSDFKPPVAVISLPGGGEFTVSGISLTDLSELVRMHYDAMAEIYEKVKSGENSAESIMGIARHSPVVAAHVIALCSGEGGAFNAAMSLPWPIQVQALTAIMQLTFEVVGGPGNALAAMTSLIRGLTGAAKESIAAE